MVATGVVRHPGSGFHVHPVRMDTKGCAVHYHILEKNSFEPHQKKNKKRTVLSGWTPSDFTVEGFLYISLTLYMDILTLRAHPCKNLYSHMDMAH